MPWEKHIHVSLSVFFFISVTVFSCFPPVSWLAWKLFSPPLESRNIVQKFFRHNNFHHNYLLSKVALICCFSLLCLHNNFWLNITMSKSCIIHDCAFSTSHLLTSVPCRWWKKYFFISLGQIQLFQPWSKYLQILLHQMVCQQIYF